ncbi:MerR family transcriptional regulator [Paenibacillus sp. GCM10027627]|uniref:MerR family transcriptional regulator n=1 Tax=unclassified Paenibacillus TaxID=185978 RepID=UPI0036330464
MGFTISEVAERTQLSIHTIRYYDKEGLLPFVERENGTRVFHEQDMDWIDLICCLKKTGMPIKDIRILIDHCMDNDAVLDKGLDILARHKEKVMEQMKELQQSLVTLDYKMKHLPQMYKEKFHRGNEQ